MPPWSILDALELVASAHGEPSELEDLLGAIARTARDTIPRSDYASMVAWYDDGHLQPLVATGPAVDRADDLQCRSLQGPSYEVLTADQTSQSGDLGKDERWPTYGRRAASWGLRSQLAMRVHDGSRTRLGLTLYSRDLNAFPHPVEAAGVLVDYAHGVLTGLADLTRIRRAMSAGTGSSRDLRPAGRLPEVVEYVDPGHRRPALHIVPPAEFGQPATYGTVSRQAPGRSRRTGQ